MASPAAAGWLPSATVLEFVCPRCGGPTTASFYGPCESCCGELRSHFSGAGRAVDAPEYEPKLNVTPNAVALRDD